MTFVVFRSLVLMWLQNCFINWGKVVALVCERGTICQLKKLVCERGTICQLKVCNRSIEKGKGCDLRGFISVATKEIREETFARRLEIDG